MAQRPGEQAGADSVKGRYVCPKCASSVHVHFVFTGWEDGKLDPNTGEAYKLIAAERSEIHDMDYYCSDTRCDWAGDEEWFESIGEQNEQET